LTGVLVVFALAAARAWAGAADQPRGDARLTVHFIDVGQGDAVLVQAPSGKRMLVDGGPAETSDRLVSYLKRHGVSSVDVVVATHPHADHIGGLLEVLKAFSVGLVVDSGKIHTTTTYERFLTLVDQKGASFRLGRAGDVIDLGPGLDVTILHPSEPLAESMNDCSIVLRLRFRGVSFLLMGDAEREAEDAILRSGLEVRADVLKVAHHGSSSSSSPRFLKAVSPAIAVVLVGAGNPFGHPHQATLRNLVACGSRVFRTDIHGDVVVGTDGSAIRVETGR
jgi:beta-lactamase superfamily II metal-dependent hydrolase